MPLTVRIPKLSYNVRLGKSKRDRGGKSGKNPFCQGGTCGKKPERPAFQDAREGEQAALH